MSADLAVRLTEIRLEHFRNLADGHLEVPPEGAVLVGANGQGKTNFLEAVHYLSAFRSFRRAPHAEAIAFDAAFFRVAGEVGYADGGGHAVAVGTDGRGRRITLDGHPTRPLDAAGAVLTVLLLPDDLALVAGSPGERRRYLDGLLSLVSERYRRGLREYERVLKQRNELLRTGARAPSLLETWDEALVAAGTGIVRARARMVERLAARFEHVGGAIAGPGARTSYDLAYRPSVPLDGAPADDDEAVGRAWSRALVARFERDRARGWTTVGPHRDELELGLAGRELGRFGSQGEQRTAAVALRLMEAEVLEADTGHRPILLLDDVFSELDPERAERLLAWLGDRHQRFVTTPRPLPFRDDGLARWEVAAGRIEPRAVAAGSR